LKNKLKIPAETYNRITMNTQKRYNEEFIVVLDKISNIMLKQGETFRARAYQKAQEAIMVYPNDIYDASQLTKVANIGSSIIEKLNEYVKTGTIALLEQDKNNPINLFSDIYGIGPKKAQDLINAGIKSIDELRLKQSGLLNDIQKIGLKYYEQIQQRIPRNEIQDFENLFTNVFESINGDGFFEIVGSYRRGAETSGDIDVIISDKTGSGSIYKKFVDNLVQSKIIVEVLSRGPCKTLVIAKLPGTNRIARRIDFLYAPPDEYAFAVLYFTGSKIFNTVMRQHALIKGYTFNEHDMCKLDNKKKGEKVNIAFNTEKDIFEFLGLEYKTPVQRRDGRDVIMTNINVKNDKTEETKEEEEIIITVTKKTKTCKKKEPELKQEDPIPVFPELQGEATTGKTKVWSIRVFEREGHGVIETSHGYIDGKMQVNEKVINEGKNVGKKNETTPLQQAVSEARSAWIKKKESGYSESDALSTICVVGSSLGKGITADVPLPMLAHDYNKRGNSIKYPCYVQRKYDGTRCVAIPGQGLYSRNRKDYPHLKHIVAEINQLSPDIILDGELYSDTLTFQEIVGLVKRETLKQGDEEKQYQIKFHVYDIITNKPYEQRYRILQSLFQQHNFQHLIIVQTEICNSEAHMKGLHNTYVVEGYEGIMVRNKMGLYKNARSADLQKYKEFFDDDYEVVDYKEGEGQEEGCVLWICKTPEGKIFSCRPRGTREDRIELFKNGGKYIGKKLTVRFQELTDEKVPRFPVGITFRDYE
jgi:DNA polymerase/3'-5' exonuclease PolX